MKSHVRGTTTIAFLGAAIAFGGCGDDDGGTSSGNGEGLSEITFPFAIGNEWVFETVEDTVWTATPAFMETLRIVDERMEDGESYYVLHDIPNTDSDEILIRQEGQNIYVIPPFDDDEFMNDNPFEKWMERKMTESLPWKFADLDAPQGASWTELDAESTFVEKDGTYTVHIEARGRSLGRSSLSVPAGDFTDVHGSEITTQTSVTVNTREAQDEVVFSSTQQLWIAADVGLVMNVQTDTDEDDNEDDIVVTITAELHSYDLME